MDAKPESKPYQWRILAPEDAVSRLLAIVQGCLSADEGSRWTVEQVVDALSAVRGSLSLKAGGILRAASAVNVDHTAPGGSIPGHSEAGGMASTPVLEPGTYDVLAVLDGLISVGVEDEVVASVADAIAHLAVTSLGALKSCGVSGAKGLAVRRVLSPQDDYPLVSVTATTKHCRNHWHASE